MTQNTREIEDEFLKNGTIISKDKHHVLIGWGDRTWSQTPLRGDAPDFYFPDFFLKIGMPWFTHKYWMEISIDQLKKLPEKSLPTIDWKMFQQPFFESKFAELKQSFQSEKLEKAVPYLFETTKSRMSKDQLERSLSSLLNHISQYPAYIYGLWNDEEGFLGATPEILFENDENAKLQTVACAGTYKSEEKNFEVDDKLLSEHGIVVKGIQSSLHSFGNIEVKPIQSIKFAALSHLVTPIEVTLNEPLNFIDLVKALHPTPALGAYPKKPGMLWLEQYQMGVPRGRYGAPAGFYFKDHAKCVVAIRNVQWNREGMSIGAGCGVVPGSSLNLELEEIKLKLKAIKELLKL